MTATTLNPVSAFEPLVAGSDVQTGVLGLYLQPIAGQPIPSPGTVLSFTVTATSTTNPAITKSRVVTFTVPAIDAVTLSANQPGISATRATRVPSAGKTCGLSMGDARGTVRGAMSRIARSWFGMAREKRRPNVPA